MSLDTTQPTIGNHRNASSMPPDAPFAAEEYLAAMGPEAKLSMEIVQQPQEGRVLPEHQRTKGHTWPIDPPPVLELVCAYPVGDWRARLAINDPSFYCLAELITDTLHKTRKQDHGKSSPQVTTWPCTTNRVRVKDNELPADYLAEIPFTRRSMTNEAEDRGFFVFGDLNVKLPGKYRLRFTLYRTKTNNGEFLAQPLASVTSNEFTVSNAKGNTTSSTPFSRKLAENGIKVKLRAEPIKRVHRKRSWHQDKAAAVKPQIALMPGAQLTSSSANQRGNIGDDISRRVQTVHVPLQQAMSHLQTSVGPYTQAYAGAVGQYQPPNYATPQQEVAFHGGGYQHFDHFGIPAGLPGSVPVPVPVPVPVQGSNPHLGASAGLPMAYANYSSYNQSVTNQFSAYNNQSGAGGENQYWSGF